MPRPPPWWPEPLKQWARETHAATPRAGSLPKFLRDHPDEVRAFMKGFLRNDAPRVRKAADAHRAPPPEGERAIIDDLPVEKRRQICAAGRLLWTGFTLPRFGRTRGDAA